MPEQVSVSIVIPAYNEETRIESTLRKTIEFMDQKPYGYEILVVDDGSTDGTVDVVHRYDHGTNQGKSHLRCILNGINEGKGNAVKKGALAAQGEYVFFMDADLSTPIEEIDRFYAEIQKYDVVIGSRATQGANIVVHEPFYREILGKVFCAVVRVCAVPNFADTQCGAKMFRSKVVKSLFPLLRIKRFAFDVEILYLAWKNGFTIKELPITWYYSTNSRVRTFQDGFRMVFDLLRIRSMHGGANPKKNEKRTGSSPALL